MSSLVCHVTHFITTLEIVPYLPVAHDLPETNDLPSLSPNRTDLGRRSTDPIREAASNVRRRWG